MTDFPPFKLSFPEESVRITANPRAVITDNDLPDIKLKTQVNFPASVRAGPGISITSTDGSYVISASGNNLQNFANDAAAATGGIPVNGLYRNGSIVMVRVS